MPKTADQKPRNRARRQKYQKDRATRVTPTFSPRQSARRLLRQNYLEVVAAQRELEASLRKVGLAWRHLEKAVNAFAQGKWTGVDQQLLMKMFKANGISEETKIPVAA